MIINSIKEIRSSILKLKQNLNFSTKDIIAYLFANSKNINHENDNDYEYNDNNNNLNSNEKEKEKEIQRQINKSILSLNTPNIIDCVNDSSLPICQ